MSGAGTGRDPVRTRTIVLGVIREALRATATEGVAIAAPPGPEANLLEEWLRSARPPIDAADLAEEVRSVPEAGDGATDGADRDERWRFVARRRAGSGNLLPLHPIHKTAFLLCGAPPPEPLLPLADVYGSRIREWTGDCSLPAVLEPWGPEVLEAVDEALGAYLEDREPWSRAVRALEPELAGTVRDALVRGRWHRTAAPVVPKLGGRTPGIDLDL